MVTVAGKVQKEMKLSGMNKLDQKKAEREERKQQKRLADMDPLVRQIKQYREDAEKMRESNQMASVDTKMKSGEGLTPEEEEYLKENCPDAYREYQEIKQEREAYKRQLKSCRTKEDVEKLKLNKMGNFMAEARKISANPVIPKEKKRGLMEKLLKKTMGVQKVHLAFTKTSKYQNLPTEEELTEKVKEKADREKETLSEKKSEEQQAIPGMILEEDEEETEEKASGEIKAAAFEDVKQTITDYLTTDRPMGYGLEYKTSTERNKKC